MSRGQASDRAGRPGGECSGDVSRVHVLVDPGDLSIANRSEDRVRKVGGPTVTRPDGAPRSIASSTASATVSSRRSMRCETCAPPQLTSVMSSHNGPPPPPPRPWAFTEDYGISPELGGCPPTFRDVHGVQLSEATRVGVAPGGARRGRPHCPRAPLAREPTIRPTDRSWSSPVLRRVNSIRPSNGAQRDCSMAES